MHVSHLPLQVSTCIATVTQNGGQGSLTEGEGPVQLTSMLGKDQLLHILKLSFNFFAKQANSMGRSTVLSLPS
jgi:hypothetical protein